ncbi:MAG: LysM peptidoglycan-binding domain-containing protein [Betaproteobacteria bacterium]
MKALALLVVLSLVLSGCVPNASKPDPQSNPVPKPPPPDEPRPPKPLPPPPPPPIPRPPTVQEKAEAQRLALHAADALELGNQLQARSDLEESRKLDPNNSIGVTLRKQFDVDPWTVLGKEYWSYTVLPGESLSRIAERFLGDKYLFYILARYNNIRVPRQLGAGQVIRIPGKPPPPKAKPTTSITRLPPGPKSPERPSDDGPAEHAYQDAIKAMRAGNLESAYRSYDEAMRASPQNPELRANLDHLRKELADAYYVAGMKAYYDQDLKLAIRLYDRVLILDPTSSKAKNYRQSAIELQDKIDKMGKPR